MLGLSPQILILIASIAASAASGWRVTAWYYQSEISDMRADKARAAQQAESANRKIELLGLELAGVVSERDAYRNRKQRTVEIEVSRDVIKYVQNPAIARCDLADDWVRVHDRAASGGMSEDTQPPGTVDAAARAVTDADALMVVTENYGACRNTQNQLIALQEWAAGLQRLN